MKRKTLKKMNRQEYLRELRDVALLFLVGLIITAVVGYTKSTKQFLVIGSYMGMMWVFLWKGNAYISNLLSDDANWLNTPLKSFLIVFAATVTYTTVSVYLLIQFYEWAFGIDFGGYLPTILSAMVVTIIITLFMHGRGFLVEWKQSVIDAERLKNESVTAKYESLKNQVNPHFLFNSLNALTNLVYEDQNLAAKFIKQLSEVYRYVLDTRNQELVSEKEELKFLESYAFLQQIRFGNNLNIAVSLNGVKTSFPPLVLQMLIENAIKHNEVSGEHPLTVKIYKQDDYVIVENNLRPRKVLKEDSPGIGLSNISSRYEFLSDKKVEINTIDGKFVVKLPILA